MEGKLEVVEVYLWLWYLIARVYLRLEGIPHENNNALPMIYMGHFGRHIGAHIRMYIAMEPRHVILWLSLNITSLY